MKRCPFPFHHPFPFWAFPQLRAQRNKCYQLDCKTLALIKILHDPFLCIRLSYLKAIKPLQKKVLNPSRLDSGRWEKLA